MRRKNNQDAMNSMVSSDQNYWSKRGHLFLVADGMGGMRGGSTASKLAVKAVEDLWVKESPHWWVNVRCQMSSNGCRAELMECLAHLWLITLCRDVAWFEKTTAQSDRQVLAG